MTLEMSGGINNLTSLHFDKCKKCYMSKLRSLKLYNLLLFTAGKNSERKQTKTQKNIFTI